MAPDGERPPATLSRNVKVVSAVSFFQDTASELLYPVLPFFVTTILGASPAVLGLIEGLAEGTSSTMKAFSGRFADRHRRLPMIFAGYGMAALGKTLVAVTAVAGGWPVVLVGRCADRFGKGLRGPPRDALIADESDDANRGRAFGFHRAADTAGAVAGPLLGLAMFEALGENLRPLFFIALVPAVLSTAMVLLIRERPHAGQGAPRVPFRPGLLPGRYWRLMAILGLFALVNFPDTLLLLRAGELGLSYPSVVAIYVLYNLSYAGLSYPAGVLSDRIQRRHVFAVGLAIFSIVYLGFGLAGSSAWMWALLPLYGCYTALTDGVSRAWVADVVPAAERGTALGVHAAISGVGVLTAGVLAGLLWNGTGHLPFLFSGTVAAVLAAVLGLSNAFGPHVMGPPADVVAGSAASDA